jgi:hypothetical protein
MPQLQPYCGSARPSVDHQDYPTGPAGKADRAASQLYFQRSTSPLLATTVGLQLPVSKRIPPEAKRAPELPLTIAPRCRGMRERGGTVGLPIGGTEEQRSRLLPPFLKQAGAPLAGFCATEPGGSANVASPPPGERVRTTARFFARHEVKMRGPS